MSRFLRAPVVSEYQSRERGPLFWKMYTALTWGATLIGGVTMFSVDYAGNSRGNHVLKSAQEWTRRTYEDVILNGGQVNSRGGGVESPVSPLQLDKPSDNRVITKDGITNK